MGTFWVHKEFYESVDDVDYIINEVARIPKQAFTPETRGYFCPENY